MDIFIETDDGNGLWLCGAEIDRAMELMEITKDKTLTIGKELSDSIISILDKATGRKARPDRIEKFIATHSGKTASINKYD